MIVDYDKNLELKRFQIKGFRSIKNLAIKVERLTVVLGENGTGKTNLYKSLHALQASANGTLSEYIASDGGMDSVVFAGKRHEDRVRISFELDFESMLFNLALGFPIPTCDSEGAHSLFSLDLNIKEESLHLKLPNQKRLLPLLRRDGRCLKLGVSNEHIESALSPYESMLSQFNDFKQSPEVCYFREVIKRWRFYHMFRCDAESPVRRPQVGFWSPILNHDGSNLASTLQSIKESGHYNIGKYISEAFPGCSLRINRTDGVFSIKWYRDGIYRAFGQTEISDGTLRYLCLLAALLSPISPALLVLNEPESGLHERLMHSLGDLILAASERSQVIVITHDKTLAHTLCNHKNIHPVQLEMVEGQTIVTGTHVDF